MSSSPERKIAPIRTEAPGQLLMAGLSGEFSSPAGIPELWQQFVPNLGKVTGQVGNVAYGVIFASDPSGKFKYMAAMRVNNFTSVPAELEILTIPAQKYLVFRHDGHASQLSSTIEKICKTGVMQTPGPVANDSQVAMLEYYGEKFDPATGTGDMEVWVPTKE